MSKSLSMTLPDRVHAALTTAGDEFGMTASEFLNAFLFTAATTPAGALLNLRLPPLPKADDEPQLPLGGGNPI